MSAVPIEIFKNTGVKEGDDDSRKQFKTRESQEIVVGFIGPIGCGIAKMVSESQRLLEAAGYVVRRVKISEYLRSQIDAKVCSVKDYENSSSYFRRYNELQDAGTMLRKELGSACLAEFAMEKIGLGRISDAPQAADVSEIVPLKVAYLIDQLKHPDEIHMLRTVYRRLFYLIGTTSYRSNREEFLIEMGLTADEAESLIERDRREDEEAGQQLEKALKLADLYVRNKVGSDHYKGALERFFHMIHGQGIHTPTAVEYGMYLAHAAGAQSACLSRQVGAAIVSRAGGVISTGRNDVPRAGGGLYPEDSTDKRCFAHGGYCRNVTNKDKLRNDMKDSLLALRQRQDSGLAGLSEVQLEELMSEIYKKSGIANLIEFSRSVHAEMDAIVTAARMDNGAIEGATLFTTTFPCHSCARHIVAAGILKVYYIEPYEKSLAFTLHDDAISFDEEELDEEDEAAVAKKSSELKVRFVHFEGVSPRAYIDMFLQHRERKDKAGTYLPGSINDGKKIPEYLDAYKEFEARAVDNFLKRTQRLRESKIVVTVTTP